MSIQNCFQEMHGNLAPLRGASVTLPNGKPVTIHTELGPHSQWVHMQARGPWWFYATPDFDVDGTIACCLENEETTEIPVHFDVPVVWTGDLEIDLATYSRETTKALSKALKAID